MDKIENVNLNEALKDIAECNTFFHRDHDLNISFDQLKQAVQLDDPAENMLILVSTPSGIDCYNESEVLQKNTYSHNSVIFHGFDMQKDLKLAYAVEVTGEKDGAVIGNIYQIDIRQYAETVKNESVDNSNMRLYFGDNVNNSILMTKSEFDDKYPNDLPKNVTLWRHEPDNPIVLQKLLDGAKQDRETNSTERSLWSHTTDLYDNRITFHANTLINAMDNLHNPNSADKQSFSAQLDGRLASAFNPEILTKILNALPYENASFVVSKGSGIGSMNLVVPRDDILQLREPATQNKKTSVLDTLNKTKQKSKERDKKNIPAAETNQKATKPKKTNREEIG